MPSPAKAATLAAMQLTDEQMRVRDNEGKLLVVGARAGSGKTATMVALIQKEIADGADPESILAITFTVVAAREIQQRLGVELGHVGTLHSFVLRHTATDVGRIADDGEVAALVAEAFANLSIRGLSTKQVLAAMEDVIDPPGDVGVVVRYVCTELRARGQTTFSLMLRQFLAELRAGKHMRKFSLMVVDEAQDTAPIDAAIYDLIDAATRVFIGDSLQAIYNFRGCDDRFFRRMARRATDFLTLSTTFRCRQAICVAANRLFPMAGTMISVHTDGEGYVEAIRYRNEAAELKGIEAWARQCYGTRAVLCRYNADVARVGAWLMAGGMKVRLRRAEPDKLLVAALRYLAKPSPEREAAVLVELGERARKVAELWKSRAEMEAGRPLAWVLREFGIDERTADEAAPHGVTISEALEAALRGELPGEADPTEVVVGTIHSVKGREFDDVLVASCYAPGKRADEDEEARIFYVGITRARNTATVTFAERRIDGRTLAELAGVPSPFIGMAGIRIVEKHLDNRY